MTGRNYQRPPLPFIGSKLRWWRELEALARSLPHDCRYSVSDRHPRKDVTVKYGEFDVDIYELTGEHICHHRRSYQKGSITIDPTMYAESLAARPRAKIKKSENEYTDELAMYPDAENGYGEPKTAEILNGIKDRLESVRPAPAPRL